MFSPLQSVRLSVNRMTRKVLKRFYLIPYRIMDYSIANNPFNFGPERRTDLTQNGRWQPFWISVIMYIDGCFPWCRCALYVLRSFYSHIMRLYKTTDSGCVSTKANCMAVIGGPSCLYKLKFFQKGSFCLGVPDTATNTDWVPTPDLALTSTENMVAIKTYGR